MYIEAITLQDIPHVVALYRKVAAKEGGLARVETEITTEYVENFVTSALETGYSFCARPEPNGPIAGEIHTYALGPKVFAHILGELTIAVDPEYQGQGIGKQLFQHLLKTIETDRPDIQRVELIARESNHKALVFYQKLGFVIEGRFERRIRSVGGGYEADIPMAWYRKA